LGKGLSTFKRESEIRNDVVHFRFSPLTSSYLDYIYTTDTRLAMTT